MLKFASTGLFVFSVIASALLVSGCSTGTGDQPKPQAAAQPADTRAADEAAIRAASEAWSQAYGAKDLDKASAVYTDDAVVMSPKAPAVHGKDAIRQGLVQMFAMPGRGCALRRYRLRNGHLRFSDHRQERPDQRRKRKIPGRLEETK